MLNYFFTYDIHLPEGVGISLFGGEHFRWLIFSIFACMALCRIYLELPQTKTKTMRRIIALCILSCELTKAFVLIRNDLYSIYYLPLHLCNLAGFFILFHAITNRPLVAHFLYAICMPGAICALLFPDWIRYPAFNLLSINSFLEHILLVAYPILLVARKEITPNVTALPRCFLILCGLSIPVYIFDKLFEANYMFLNWPSPGSPLEVFAKFWGEPGYLLGFIPLLLTAWLLLYTPFLIVQRRKAWIKNQPISSAVPEL